MRSIIKKEFTLSNEEQEILARACRIKKFKYAETIYNEVDDRTHYYYLIMEILKLQSYTVIGRFLFIKVGEDFSLILVKMKSYVVKE